MDLARDVIDQEGDMFEFHTTRLVAAVVTQIFSYMHDLGIQNGCIRTGEAFVFLHIPEDPTIVQYYLCFPNQDVQAGDESCLHQTAVGQMLAFTLQALAAEAPSQEWYNTAHEQLSTWKVEYLDVLRDIPETIRKEPPPSNYRPSYWKLNSKTQYTFPCSLGQRHPMGPRDFTRKLHDQLVQNRNKGFELLHIRGRTGYLMKATLLSHGYTVVIKATTKENQHALTTEVDNYRKLRSLQGYQIPVCSGDFEPSIAYWYHGQVMAHMMILSWSGTRLQRIIKDENLDFFHKEREKALKSLQKYGVEHRDKEWRNMPWDEQTVVDLEDMEWLKRPRPFQPTYGNSLGRLIVLRRKS
ncbi:uncharacterized protein EURHEDRAFT_378011 [Aspergillus ruber CBS 135680]|uniref:Protein kinase domain-containing protein n=1 Tax=Aspergillus ruber (strain CBS 135680) TaxID=1388766 RepID=A0A017SEA9_ASPRC|nr:uncharacterized protein EURHEDRAFT_378011 [Aspergillus ruber CBS 135680]EYE94545.1 hypothetical protein EURHEDRAFT_378011 [Aspergillus ruber CBS 135680]